MWVSSVPTAEQKEAAERIRALVLASLRFESAGKTFAAVAEDMRQLGLKLGAA